MRPVNLKVIWFVLVLAGIGICLFASENLRAEEKTPAQAVEVGNTLCPVSGENVHSMGGPYKHEYDGRVYNLCCPMCDKTFAKDPEKYSRIALDEVKEAPKASSDNIRNRHDHSEHGNENVEVSAGEISHYTCGMHPSVNVSVEQYNAGDTKCPICFMPLTPVRPMSSDEGFDEHTVSKVQIEANALKLAGVKTEPVEKRHLFKEIRAVGRVAYDPQLAIAQDEFISSMTSSKKASQSGIEEIASRSKNLVESSRRKLQLLGLSDSQIDELARTREVQENLILPGDKMWIYGDVFEHELNWVKEGSYITVKPIGLAGEEFYGKIVSINPVVDPRTRSVRFRAQIDNADKRLKPEMYVDIEISSQYETPEGDKMVLSIPKNAFLDTGRRKIVWVAKDNGQFEGRVVELGPEAVDHSRDPQKYYPVLRGLKEGERIVSKGAFLIDSQSQITGVASSAYGGALGEDESQPPASGHIH